MWSEQHFNVLTVMQLNILTTSMFSRNLHCCIAVFHMDKSIAAVNTAALIAQN